MLNDVDVNVIDKFIHETFPIIYDFKFDGIVLLFGGSIRSLIMGEKVRDLDFVVLSQKKCEIKQFLDKYHIKYKYNVFGGYKINYNGMEIDLSTIDDLLDVATYDTDLLFFDIEKKLLIPIGATFSYKNRTITQMNFDKQPTVGDKRRLKKLIRFVKYITGSNKRVKVKRKRFKWHVEMLKKKAKIYKNKIINGNFRKCFRFLYGVKKEFKLIVFLGIVIALSYAITPALSGNIVTNLLYGGYRNVLVIIIFMIALKLITIMSSFYLSKLYLVIMKQMVFNIRSQIAKNVVDFDISNFTENSSGSFINKIKDDPNEIASSFNKIKDILINGLGNFGVLLYIFYLNWILGLIFLIFIIIIYKIKMIGIKKKMCEKNKFLIEQEKYSTILGEMVSGIGDIKSLNLKNSYIDRTVKSFSKAGELEFKGEYYQNIYNKASSFVELFALGVVILVGLLLVKNNQLSSESLVIIFMYRTSVFTSLNRLVNFMDIRANFNLSCDRIFSLLNQDDYKKESFGNKELIKSTGMIEFKNVDFSYKTKPVLKNCSFKVGPFEEAAIVGLSGSGKTTILNLISKIHSATNGIVLIDNININELSESYLRNTISVISQNPYLFDMSIRDNLRLVKSNITTEEINNVMNLVCLDEFIESLPNKYDTMIGEGGVNLSGGERQRLAIARALIRNTPIILLDEITSSLDNNTSSIIKKVINNIKKDHTIIVVTHELNMIKDCKKIMVLDKGKIISCGNHKKLLENCEFYNKLSRMEE